MNADLTFNTIVFKKSYDLEGKSLRRSITRGINTPDDLVIQSVETVDSKTKSPMQRFNGRVDRYDIDAGLLKIKSSAYFVIEVPSTASQAQIDNVVATFKAVVADANFVVDVLAGQK